MSTSWGAGLNSEQTAENMHAPKRLPCPVCMALIGQPRSCTSSGSGSTPVPQFQQAKHSCCAAVHSTHRLAPLQRGQVPPALAAAIGAACVHVAAAIQTVGVAALGQKEALAAVQLVARLALTAGAGRGVVHAVGYGAGLADARRVQIRIEGLEVVRQAAPALGSIGGALGAQPVSALQEGRRRAAQGGLVTRAQQASAASRRSSKVQDDGKRALMWWADAEDWRISAGVICLICLICLV